MVGLNFVIAALLGFSSALCAGASLGMRGNVPLGWLAVSLACGSAQTLLVSFPAGEGYEVAAAAILAPLGYVCAGQAIRAMSARLSQGPLVLTAVTALSGLAIILMGLEAPFFYQILCIQAACAIAVTDALVQMIRQAHRRLLDAMTVLGLGLLTLACVARIPVILALFGADAAFEEVRRSGFEAVVMTVTGLLVPPIIFLLLARIIGDLIAAYQRQSEHDGLTGLLNRRAFDLMAEVGMKEGGAVIFCDIDHFKQVNDRFGHEAGDDVICTFAEQLARTGHHAGRIGGEEFALLLPGKTAAEAFDMADMIRARFHGIMHPILAPGERLSASFGVSECAPGEAPRSAFRRADVALYQAKETGRNRVVDFAALRNGRGDTVSPRQSAA
ncbi:MAG TPA: GGDEF domain-containing protein [Devosia sp.]|jgi:diguanylate cyclase (GGDEF)-like protein|nr:GGDEF domain-containing protein [Devosia sp.]